MVNRSNKPNSSEILIFQDMKKSLKEILKSDQDLAEIIIKKRNWQIKCLHSDIEHIYSLYNEAKAKYEEYYDLYEKEKELNKEKLDIISNLNAELQTHITKINNITDKHIKLNDDHETLKKEIQDAERELNDSKVTISVLNTKNNRSIRFNIEKMVNKFPDGIIKYILKFFFSQTIYQYTVFLIMCLLLIVSFIGWPAFFAVIKGFLTLL
jgi:chromosome segregation ATPase